MSAWLFGIAITLLVGATTTAYLWLIRRRDDETAAGLLALAGMRWRDFSRLVLEAMELRGLVRVPSSAQENQEHSASFLLAGMGQKLLLACKHGSAYRIGNAAVDEFASEIRLRGAQGGILVTEGVLDKGGVEKAARHNIEVVDGPLLWPAVKPLVEGNLQRRIVGNASARARRHIGIAWLGALTLGLASALVLPTVLKPVTRSVEPSPSVRAAQAGDAVDIKPVSASPSAATAVIAATVYTEADIALHRAEVSRKLSKTPGIIRGVWISRSTLSVDRSVSEQDAWPLVCRHLQAYPELVLTRIQMNPPQGSTDPVRWRQCEAL
ncbi:MAG: restriction endonuclease [Pseudoxanthomonas sp.]